MTDQRPRLPPRLALVIAVIAMSWAGPLIRFSSVGALGRGVGVRLLRDWPTAAPAARSVDVHTRRVWRRRAHARICRQPFASDAPRPVSCTRLVDLSGAGRRANAARSLRRELRIALHARIR